MPNRVVREGILDSDSVNQLTWAGEVFYRRLMSVADDYGRFDGRVDVLRAKLYPLRLDRVSSLDVEKWLTECVGAGLVRRYEVDSKPYLEIDKFGQSVRAMRSKYPSPKECEHVKADASSRKQMYPQSKRNESETELETKANKARANKSDSESEIILEPTEILRRLVEDEYITREFVMRTYKLSEEEYAATVMLFVDEKRSELVKDITEVIAHYKNWMRKGFSSIMAVIRNKSGKVTNGKADAIIDAVSEAKRLNNG